jgi:hypothetical protein
MATSNDKVIFGKKELRGSRLRCLMFTTMPRKQVARCLTEVVQPYGVVNATRDQWMPRGFLNPDEPKLGEATSFLSAEHRDILTGWWLAVADKANTPNWDVVSTCTIEDRQGLILIEAKAHGAELSGAGKTAGNEKNDRSIRAAILQANEGLNQLNTGWNLNADTHYQLCNRFAWGWKITSLGVPVILVYLGFLNVDEMADKGQPFQSVIEWADTIRRHAHGIVPDRAWNTRLEINGTPMCALIRAVDLRWVPSGEKDRGAI